MSAGAESNLALSAPAFLREILAAAQEMIVAEYFT